jgi:hypothetical protein
VEELQLGRARRELEEAEGGAESNQAAIGHGTNHQNAVTAPAKMAMDSRTRRMVSAPPVP